MKVCPACGKSNKPVAQVCEECGAELDNSIKDFDADQAKLDASRRRPLPERRCPLQPPEPPSLPPLRVSPSRLRHSNA